MNTKRIIFWASFIIILILIVWGLIVAMGKTSVIPGTNLGEPAPINAYENILGPSDAPITIIEYSDYQCPACRTYYYVIEKLLASSTVPIRFVYRHFPLPQHQNALKAALAAEASGLQGKYWEMHRLLFENQPDWENVADPKSMFIDYARYLNVVLKDYETPIDIEKFKTDLESTVLKNKIKANSDEGVKIGINATPTFFINGKAITNPSGYDEFKSIIEKSAKENLK